MAESKYMMMVVAGEASGDAHAAKLVKELRQLADIEFFGCAGPKMREAGVHVTVNADNLAIVGLPEIVKTLPRFLKAFKDLKSAARHQKPDAAILVDFPEFNLKLAKALKKQGLKVIYYISPQLWAWRKYRKRTIRKYVDLLITILPFEKDWYAEQGIYNVEYVGSPLAMEVHADTNKNDFCRKHGLVEDLPIIAFLPGSRNSEIIQILPKLLETAEVMKQINNDLQFAIAASSDRSFHEINRVIKTASGFPQKPAVIQGETYDLLNSADASAVASGTATLEAGIIGTPMAIVYKTSGINYGLMRPMISVEHFGLINLIAGERIANELIQDDFTPEVLADELFRLLEPSENKRVRERLKAAADKLGHGGASRRAAEAVLKLIDPRRNAI
ncbi:MAG: lipid-A-disaccharide synthase [Saprospiraceae bacterium]|nr:lipid-A-disaccharide synthase [Pyrinomonadaceae bacterium]